MGLDKLIHHDVGELVGGAQRVHLERRDGKVAVASNRRLDHHALEALHHLHVAGDAGLELARGERLGAVGGYAARHLEGRPSMQPSLRTSTYWMSPRLVWMDSMRLQAASL